MRFLTGCAPLFLKKKVPKSYSVHNTTFDEEPSVVDPVWKHDDTPSLQKKGNTHDWSSCKGAVCNTFFSLKAYENPQINTAKNDSPNLIESRFVLFTTRMLELGFPFPAVQHM